MHECQEKLLDTGYVVTQAENYFGYERIICDEGCNIKAIVEEKDATEDQKKIKEINSGVYVFDIEELLLV